jgi:hypothetical protein
VNVIVRPNVAVAGPSLKISRSVGVVSRSGVPAPGVGTQFPVPSSAVPGGYAVVAVVVAGLQFPLLSRTSPVGQSDGPVVVPPPPPPWSVLVCFSVVCVVAL